MTKDNTTRHSVRQVELTWWKLHRPDKTYNKYSVTPIFPEKIAKEVFAGCKNKLRPVEGKPGFVAVQITVNDPTKLDMADSKGNRLSTIPDNIGNGTVANLNLAVIQTPKYGKAVYLNGIQILKLIPYGGGSGFAADDSFGDDAFSVAGGNAEPMFKNEEQEGELNDAVPF